MSDIDYIQINCENNWKYFDDIKNNHEVEMSKLDEVSKNYPSRMRAQNDAL